ncbi:hypothetical protein AbraIFM66950_006206 [Aspergillus brasiliensis]|nr:hypothetical protein AbraIFM66950_006206 [Aspergillus brasiliensis]
MAEEAPGRPQDSGSVLADCKVARRMLLYLITVLGTMANPTEAQQHLCTYLGFCHTIMGHVILQPSLESVQALLLFSITLRVRDQLSPAWDVLMVAISMAQTLGLSDSGVLRHSIPEREANSNMASRCTWWTLFVFEKLLAFDSGRRSTLVDQSFSSLEQLTPTTPFGREKGPKLESYEYHLTSLANVLHEMQDRSWRAWRREDLDTRSDIDARESKIRATGAIESLLWKWRSSLPPEYQAGCCNSVDVQLTPQWAFLFFYYHQAIFVLYRNGLLLDWNEVKREVDRYGSKEPWHLRLRNGPQICLDAAKDMTNLQVAVTESATPSFLAVATSPLPAAYVLLIYIRCQPASILSRAYFEIMKAAMAISRQRHSSPCTDSQLGKCLDVLEQYVSQHLSGIADQSSGNLGLENRVDDLTTMPLSNAELLSMSLESSSLTWGSFESLSWDWNGFVSQT